MYGDVPPVTVAVNAADVPLQTAAEFTITVGRALTVSVPEPVPVQPFESVAVTLYVPPVLALIDDVVAPVLQA